MPIIKVKNKHYVKWLDPLIIRSDELLDSQTIFLDRLNKKLVEVEKNIKHRVKNLIKTGDAKVSDPNDWIEDYEIDCYITFILREDDPDYDDDDDNVLIEIQECSKHKDWEYGIGDNRNYNDFRNAKLHPMNKEHHCWLYWSLYDCTYFGWDNILRIGSIWVDINIVYQKVIELNHMGYGFR